MEILEYDFFINALIGIMLVSVACGLIGTYIVTRRLVFLSGGITHACFGGLGLGYMLGISPLIGASGFAVAGALGVDWLRRRRVRSDSAIAVIWALGMALGTLFVFLTNGYVPELNTFLFGNVLTITPTDLWMMGIFTVILILFYICFYPYIIAISFDVDFAMTRRLPTRFINTSMTVFTALCIVITIKMIGIMLLMSLMTLPQISAEVYTSRYKSLLVQSTLISLLCSVGGLFGSYWLSVPASATIVLLMTASYGLSKGVKSLQELLN